MTETTGLLVAGHPRLALLITVAVGMTAGRSTAVQDPVLYRTPTRHPTHVIAASARIGEPAEWKRTGEAVANPGGVRVVAFPGRHVICAASDGSIRTMDPVARRMTWTMGPCAGVPVALVAATLWDAVTRSELRTFRP